jgi:hypothetical protein
MPCKKSSKVYPLGTILLTGSSRWNIFTTSVFFDVLLITFHLTEFLIGLVFGGIVLGIVTLFKITGKSKQQLDTANAHN